MDETNVENAELSESKPLTQLQEDFHAATRNWRKQINNLSCQLVNDRNVESLEKGSQVLIMLMSELTEAQEGLDKVLESEVERITLFGKFEAMSQESNQVLKEVGTAICELKKIDDDRCSIASSKYSRKSGKSKSSRHSVTSSRHSVTSSTSSTRQRRLDLEEELACLKAKMNMVKVKEDLDIANRRALEQIEKKKIEIEREEKRVREQIEIATEKYEITKELAEKRARIDVCKRFEEEVAMPDFGDNDPNSAEEHIMKFLDSQPNLTSNEAQTCEVENQVIPIVSVNNQERTTSYQLDPLSPTFTSNVEIRPHTNLQDCNNQPSTAAEDSLRNPNLVQSHLNAMSKLLEMQNRSRLPLPEPGVFSGDPLQYPVWAKAFETLIESHATNSAERLYFLGKYVSGDAKAVVEGFMLLDGDDAYERAKEQLSKRFGNSFAVASAFRKRLDDWPQIAPNDGHGLRKYADLLVQCEKAMDKISSLKVLNDDQENHKMMSKLPR